MGNEDHDPAGLIADERVGERAGHAPEPPKGVEERSACVDPDSHPVHHATARKRWSVIIPTLVGWQHLREILPSLLDALGGNDEVIIVGDHRDPALPPGLDRQCRTTVNGERRGFGPSCNAGARLATGDCLLFLNDDVLVGRGVLEALATALNGDRVAVAGPDVFSVGLGRSESKTELSWHHGVLEARQKPLHSRGLVEVPYVCGAALALRRSAFAAIGGFDEQLAPYFWEDVDLSLRLCRDGSRCVVVGDVTVEHRHGATIGREDPHRRQRVYERNRLRVTWKQLEGSRWLSHVGWLALRVSVAPLRRSGVALALVEAIGAVYRSGGGRARRH